MAFIKGLVTDSNIYYVDLEEADDNGSTKIYDLDMNLLSDNIHASNALLEDLENVLNGQIKPIYINSDVLENGRLYFEQETCN